MDGPAVYPTNAPATAPTGPNTTAPDRAPKAASPPRSMLPSEQASTILPLQQQAFSCVFPESAPMQRLRPNCGCSKEALGFRRRQSRNPAKGTIIFSGICSGVRARLLA